jgi:hypothetical protein
MGAPTKRHAIERRDREPEQEPGLRSAIPFGQRSSRSAITG